MAENQKIENVLNLALDTNEIEREKSLDLNVGYNEVDKIWEVIVKYTGDATDLKSRYKVEDLLNEYAIISVEENEMENLANEVVVEYIEKPKRLFYNRNNGMRTSCITSAQRVYGELTGEDVLVAIIDSGIDYDNSEFKNGDGTTRILYIWDQSLEGTSPEGYEKGREFSKLEIDAALRETTMQGRLEKVPTIDFSGHGTEVASIAVGNNGVASNSPIIAVKLASPQKDGFPRTIELMEAIDYVIKKAVSISKPIVVNLSFGNTYGAHDGTSLLERYIDSVANLWKSSFVVSSGNEGAKAGHVNGVIDNGENVVVELAVSTRQTATNIQIWKKYEDVIDIWLVSPSGMRYGPFVTNDKTIRYNDENTQILIYYGQPSPYSLSQEIYIELIPKNDYITSGIWEINLEGKNTVTGRYSLWLPSNQVLAQRTNFLRPSKVGTITIPATASKVISVGAYDALTGNYADFSGRGTDMRNTQIKPDIIAPGVDVVTSTTGGGIRVASGTSYSAPFVTGAAALLMQWGIVWGNDSYLYGEKVKAYLHKGAIRDTREGAYPNNAQGYGKLCLENSIPK